MRYTIKHGEHSVTFTNVADAEKVQFSLCALFPAQTFQIEQELVVNGVVFGTHTRRGLMRLVGGDSIVTAIQMVRELSGCTLREAKDFMDLLRNQQSA